VENASPGEKISFFRLALASALARPRFQIFRTRYFSLVGLRPSFFDPHQSPIGIKAIEGEKGTGK